MVEVTRQGTVDVISTVDPISSASVDELTSVLDERLVAHQPRVVLDLSSVPLIDSAGLEWLLDLADECTARTGMLTLAAPNALCRDVLEVTGIARQFVLFDEVSAAVGSFAR